MAEAGPRIDEGGEMFPDKVGLKHRWWPWILTGILALIVIIIALSYLIESDVLRRYAEREMNSRLEGYTVRIGHAFFHPLAFALDLGNLTLTQNANPDPPVAR